MKPIKKKCFLCPQNKFGKCLLIRGTAKLEQMSLSNIFGTLLLRDLEKYEICLLF